jgi:hypothetical protein
MTGPSGAPAAISDGVPSYRACSTKRTRRKKTEIARIKAAIYDIVKGDRPMTVRQVFYQLVVRDLIEKTEKEYETTVIRLLTNMRLSGELPFEWIIDESRRRRITQTFNGVEAALDHTAEFYRRSALRDCEDYLEICCEKEALSGLLWDVCSKYDVPLVVSKGMPSLTPIRAPNILRLRVGLRNIRISINLVITTLPGYLFPAALSQD